MIPKNPPRDYTNPTMEPNHTHQHPQDPETTLQAGTTFPKSLRRFLTQDPQYESETAIHRRREAENDPNNNEEDTVKLTNCSFLNTIDNCILELEANPALVSPFFNLV